MKSKYLLKNVYFDKENNIIELETLKKLDIPTEKIFALIIKEDEYINFTDKTTKNNYNDIDRIDNKNKRKVLDKNAFFYIKLKSIVFKCVVTEDLWIKKNESNEKKVNFHTCPCQCEGVVSENEDILKRFQKVKSNSISELVKDIFIMCWGISGAPSRNARDCCYIDKEATKTFKETFITPFEKSIKNN